MAYATSNKYKQFIYDEDSKQSIDIIINGNTIDGSYIRSFKLTDEIFEEEIFSLGSAITSKVILELNNEALQDITSSFDAMTFVFKLETDSGIEVVPMGRYIIKEKDESSSYFTKFTLYDYMDKFDDAFDASGIVPCTRYELLQAICEYFGVELENKSILNGDVEVGVYDNTITAKTYLSLISERAGGFAKINRNNKLVIKTLSDVDTVELPDSKAGDYIKNELKTVTRIVYENATQKFESGTEDGVTIYLSQDSPFSCSQQEVDNILQKLKGLQYQTLDVRFWGDPSIDTGDIITFNDVKSFAQKDWSFGNGFYGSYKTILNDSKSTLNVSKLSGNTKRKRLESRINEVEGTIKLLSEEVTDNSSKMSQFQIDLNEITSSVSKTEDMLDEMSKAIQEFSTDLEIYNLIIPVDENKNPLETKEYTINHYSYFKGQQVEVVPSTTDKLDGITVTFDKEKIKISVNKDTTIPNLNNELSLDFAYTDENDEVYYLSKKIVITLAQKGTDGKDAPIPKIVDEQEGKSLCVEASENNAIELIIDGKSEQETSEQKDEDNLFDLTVWYNNQDKLSASNGKITINKEEILMSNPTGTDMYTYGHYHMNTNANDNQKNIVKIFGIRVEQNTKYALSYDNDNLCNTQVFLFYYDKDGNYLSASSSSITTDKRKNMTITTPANTVYAIPRFDNEGYGNDITDLKITKISLKKGTDTTYTPFAPNSPSPEYPSEIKSIPSTRNLFDITTITKVDGGIYNNGVITSNNRETVGTLNLNFKFNEIKVKSGETVYFSADIKLNENSTGGFSTMNDAVNGGTTALLNPKLSNQYQRYQTKYTYDKDTTISSMLIQIANLLGSIDVTNIMILLLPNNTYTPYGSWAKVRISGKNLFDKDTIKFYANNNSDFNSTLNTNLIRVRTNSFELLRYGYKYNKEYIISGLPKGWNLLGILKKISANWNYITTLK